MTFFGKIFVIAIMAFSTFFLALSTAVKTTTPDWKSELKAKKKSLSELQTVVDGLQQEQEKRVQELDAVVKNREALKKALETQVVDLVAEIEKRQMETVELRKQIEDVQKKVQSALIETQAQTKDLTERNAELAGTQTQRKAFESRQEELTDAITLLERELSVAESQNKELLGRIGYTSAASSP